MRCIIVRHGKAESASDSGRDEDRPLRSRGRDQAQFLARELAAYRPTLIIASRFERAISTAHIIQKAVLAPLHLASELEVGHPPSAAADLILGHAGSAGLVLVGHNPQLSELVWLLTRGVPVREAGLRTGEAVVLDLSPPTVIGAARELARLRLAGED